MAVDTRQVALLVEGNALAEALAPGLRRHGWSPYLTDRESVRILVPDEPLVVVEDEQGCLPDLVALGSIGRSRPVVAVGGVAALPEMVRAVAAGACVVNADLPYRALILAIDEALAATPMSREERAGLIARLRDRLAEAERFTALSDREGAVLGDLATGLSAEAIAVSRTVGLSTVRTQIAAVLRKLRVRSQAAAVTLAYRSCVDRRVRDQIHRFLNFGDDHCGRRR